MGTRHLWYSNYPEVSLVFSSIIYSQYTFILVAVISRGLRNKHLWKSNGFVFML